jgi:hypothetical protein
MYLFILGTLVAVQALHGPCHKNPEENSFTSNLTTLPKMPAVKVFFAAPVVDFSAGILNYGLSADGLSSISAVLSSWCSNSGFGCSENFYITCSRQHEAMHPQNHDHNQQPSKHR